MTSQNFKILVCVLRAPKGVWESLKELEKNSGGRLVVWQGQAKTFDDDLVNPTLFAQGDFDDHPGPPPAKEDIARYEALLYDPANKLHIVNTLAGPKANNRARCGEMAIMHGDLHYRANGGISRIIYDLLYDGDGRNDKIHISEWVDKSTGITHKISEGNAPVGKYAPISYKRGGADAISVFDPHSKLHEQNLENAFGKDNVEILSSLEPMAEAIIEDHKNAILEERFRLGAPDGWDKKDDPQRNAATERVKATATHIWEKLPQLHSKYKDFAEFHKKIQFGITKVRESDQPGVPGQSKVTGFFGDVKGCNCVLLDDLTATGGSLVQSGISLLENGASKVDAAICHGPSKQSTLQRLLHDTCEVTDENGDKKAVPVINRVILTNTMAGVENLYDDLPGTEQQRLHLVNCGKVFAEYIKRKSGLSGPAPIQKTAPAAPPPHPPAGP